MQGRDKTVRWKRHRKACREEEVQGQQGRNRGEYRVIVQRRASSPSPPPLPKAPAPAAVPVRAARVPCTLGAALQIR